MFANGLNTRGYFQSAALARQYSIGGVLFCGETRSATRNQELLRESLRIPAGGSTLQLGICDAYFPNQEQ